MATELSQEAVLDFLTERGGRVPNTELVEHFKALFPGEPTRKAAAREAFKTYVDSVAYVKTDDDVKYVCLKKKFRVDTLPRVKAQGSDVKQERELKQDAKQHKHGAQVSGSDVKCAAGVQSSSNFNHSEVPHVLHGLQQVKQAQSEGNVCVVVEDCSSSDAMGNRSSVKREKGSKREKNRVEIPVITVSQPSPLPVQETALNVPGLELEPHANTKEKKGEAKESTRSRQVLTLDIEQDDGKCSDVEDDVHSLTGSDGTPKSSRKHFIEAMMCSSPEVRRNIDLRCYSPTDSDSASVISCSLEEDRNSVALDPLEHEWMLCASDGDWGSLQKLLNDNPGLVLKKDFVTGFTCLHWAAKQGKPELIALIVNFAKQNNVTMSVDVRSSTGYTPLHIAAMHNHMEVVKLLVGAYNADVEIRDYSGRKPCQYLTDNVSVDIRDIIGAYEIETENKPASTGKRWRFTKALQPKPLRRLNSTGDSDTPDSGAREEPMRRRSSLTKMKPKLEKLRWRTSQLVHSTTFHGAEDLQKRQRSRPKTHFFG